ncbi:dehydrogenase [Sphingobium sp. LB126]|uniref:YCII-related domain-containing protein n=1 Tax=Sphingobium chungbukense TaxID=56193 RepID=A0A0M3AMY9_9SPHN|nr:hypothetical protein YP76_14135 [Sphingobium chungbukense]PJG46429.1 dehydrogenase [Sphingobium sp. LB126]
MRVMVLVKATEDSERGGPPSAEMFEEMGKFNDALIAAGIMVDCDGLKPSSSGKRIAFDGASRTVIDGPFAHPRELVAGYWIWEVRDMEEAITWARRCPNPMPGPSELEIRPFFQRDDLQAMGPEIAEVFEREQDRRAGP